MTFSGHQVLHDSSSIDDLVNHKGWFSLRVVRLTLRRSEALRQFQALGQCEPRK